MMSLYLKCASMIYSVKWCFMEPDKKEVSTRSIIRVFGRELAKQPFLFALILIGVVGEQAMSVTIPVFMRALLNILASHDVNAVIVHSASVTIGIIAALMIARLIFNRMEIWYLSTLETRACENLILSSFEYLVRHSHTFFANQFAGTLTRRINKYATAFVDMVDSVVMDFLPAALFVSGAIVVLYIHSAALGIILGVWTVLFVTVQIYLSRLQRPLRVERSLRDSKLGGAVADAIGNQSTITTFAGVAHERNRLQGFTDLLRVAQLRSWHFTVSIWGIQSFLMVCVNIALLWGALHYWQRGQLTIGDFILIQTYLVGAFQMLSSVSFRLRRFYDSFADAGEMVAILETPHEVRDIPDAKSLAITQGAVDFKDVSFHFNEQQPILTHLNLSIKPGEKVALVGPSGAGKSTITKLLLRFYDVKGGSIEIDGHNIAQVTQDSLREAIAFVPQEPILFHRTLTENIRYGKRDATDEEVIEAAKKAHCHEFIQHLKYQYDTYVGERGVKLSGGERQRVAIARAILKDAPILILDEATSSLDSESESLIQDSLKVLMQGKTVLVIAHRLSTIMNMDRIVVIEGGDVVADGTHQELLAQGGLYAKLWSIQAGGFLRDEEDEGDKSIAENVA